MFAISSLGWIEEYIKKTLKPTNITPQGQPIHEKIRSEKKKMAGKRISDHDFRRVFVVGLGWPWIVTFDGFNTISSMFSNPTPTHTKLVQCKHPDQSINLSINQSTNQSIGPSFYRSIGQSYIQSIKQCIYHLTSQSTNPSCNQSTNKLTNQSIQSSNKAQQSQSIR